MSKRGKAIASATRAYDAMTRHFNIFLASIIAIACVIVTTLLVTWGVLTCIGEPRPLAGVKVNRLERIYQEGMFTYTDVGAFDVESGDLYSRLVEGACYDVTVRPNCGAPLLVSATRVACPERKEMP